MIGKTIRMERIFDRKSGNAVIVPMDHGISVGPINGLIDTKNTVDQVANGGATAVLMHKGLIKYSHRGYGKDIGLIMHLSASTEMGYDKTKSKISDVEEAMRFGADAVSIHLNFGTERDGEMLSQAGEISKECEYWGMPLVIMAYHVSEKKRYDPATVAHCARAASELGADIVKVSYTGDIDSFSKVCEGALAPVVIAGGPKIDSDVDVLKMVKDSLDAGGHGVSIGRNIFQNKNVKGMTKAISEIVLERKDIVEAMKSLE